MSNQNESLNVNAKSVDEAIKQGLSRLGLTLDQVDVEVINEGKRSLFGLKTEDAVVRLTPKSAVVPPTEAVAPPPEAVAPPPAPDDTPAVVEADATEQDKQPLTEDAPVQATAFGQEKNVAKLGMECLSNLLQLMGIKATVAIRQAPDLVEPGETPPLVLDITGHDLGILIGRRNETLQALQFMVRTVVNKETGSWHNIVVDVESYRSRRRQSLYQMAKRMAERAVANRERVVLEAMPAYERRLIHLALKDHPAVFTKSIGQDNNRKVTIVPK